MKTRFDKATELRKLISNGPSLSLDVFGAGVQFNNVLTTMENEAVENQVKLWLSTWVEPLCRELIKEYPNGK